MTKKKTSADWKAAVGPVSPTTEKLIAEAAGEFFNKMSEHGPEVSKAYAKIPVDRQPGKPKSWITDPFALLDSIGLGYRANPSIITYDTLRQMSERDTVLAAVILTRINQVAAFCRPQENKYSVGFEIRPRGGVHNNRRLTRSEKQRIAQVTSFVCNMGIDDNIERDGFEKFMRKAVRDRLTYDQVNFEKVRTLGGKLHSVYAVPADTIRIAHPQDSKGTPPSISELKKVIRYIQLVNGEIVAEFTPKELAFLVANPRTSMRVYGYGFPETEVLISTITAHIWAEEWNRRAFSQGSTIKGILNLKGNIPPVQFESFKRQWFTQV
jgi:hypothetical protein